MYKAYKYRIYPNKEQQTKMNQFFGCCRFVYNKCIEWYSVAYKSWKETGTDIGKTPLLTEFKKDNEFLKECDNAALAYSRSNFERAIKDFIKLPKIGLVKCVKHRDFDGIIKAVTVERKPSGKYYISIMVECSNEIELKINKKNNYNNLNVVGLDMSLSDFVVSSHEEDNTIVKYVRNYRKNEKHLSKLQRKLSRKEKGSKNRMKSKRQVAVLHEKIVNQRKDFITKTALYFARKYDVIVLEDINLQNMSRTLHLGKSVADLGFGEFRTILEQKCKEYDTTIIYADKWYASSKTCSSCGVINKSLKLSDREWVCTECGTYHNRDFNAALNLEYYFTNQYNTVGTTEINACGDNASTLRAIVMQVMSLNQEVPFL